MTLTELAEAELPRLQSAFVTLIETLELDMRAPDRRQAEQARAFFASLLDKLSGTAGAPAGAQVARRITVDELESRFGVPPK